MDGRRRCKACEKLFTPHRSVPMQQYCSAGGCQKARRRLTQKRKMAEDPDYRDNQRRAQKQWRDSHSGYWRRYRADHPEYDQRNRERQRERNARRRELLRGTIAKMDELSRENNLISGRYKLVLLGDGVAKMDELMVEITAVKAGCG